MLVNVKVRASRKIVILIEAKGWGDVWGIAMASLAAAYSGHSAVGDTDAPVSGKCKISLSFFGYHLV